MDARNVPKQRHGEERCQAEPKPADGQRTQTEQRASSSVKHTRPLPSHPVQSAEPARRLFQTVAGFKPSGFSLTEPEAMGPDCHYYCCCFVFLLILLLLFIFFRQGWQQIHILFALLHTIYYFYIYFNFFPHFCLTFSKRV